MTAEAAGSADLAEREREALGLGVELARLGSSGDPIERESILRRIIDQCGGTEEAEAAYWTLADLYLDAFSEPKEDEARGVLELFLERCPASRWTTQVKCRLLALHAGNDKRAVQLRRELQKDDALPAMLRSIVRGQ